jgi:hypothetical protein
LSSASGGKIVSEKNRKNKIDGTTDGRTDASDEGGKWRDKTYTDSAGLESKVGLEVLSDFTDQSLERPVCGEWLAKTESAFGGK